MKKKQYLREIADRACLPRAYRKRMVDGLAAEFDALRSRCEDDEEVIRRMGKPDEVAAALYESYLETEDTQRPFAEYRSKIRLFGLPLVHIVKSQGAGSAAFARTGPVRRNRWDVPTARGIIAIGWRAKGVIAIGNLCCGLITLGNISLGVINIANIGLGLFGVGNVVLGLLAAFGNLAAGFFSIGNGALGFCAVGNAAAGQYALGHSALGATAQSVEAFSQTQVIASFVQRLPQSVQGFFHFAVGFIDNIAWVLIPLAVLLLAVITATAIAMKRIKPGR